MPGTLGYDAKNRLTVDVYGWAYAYDSNDNRTLEDDVPYLYQTNSNRLTSIDGIPFTYNATGSATQLLDNLAAYNNQGRMSQIYHDGVTTTYKYNARGLRTHKINSTTTIYHYDLRGHLILETNTSGTAQKAYVWRNTTPIAQIEGSNITYIHTDHLNTPRTATNQTKIPVWTWWGDAFGYIQPIENGVTINLRFPGQYYDKESHLHYNWNRYYMPLIGRYITSDPIGLEGGLNTYGYVNGNPLKWFDLNGLIKLPPNPGDLPPGWQEDPSHKNPNGKRYRHPGGDYLDWHKGQRGAPGWRGKDHWHHNGDKEHLVPGEEVPDPLVPSDETNNSNKFSCDNSCKERRRNFIRNITGTLILIYAWLCVAT